MHGCGNDYIYVNTMQFSVPNPSEVAVVWSDRHKGIGSDGLVLIGASPVPEADYSMHIYNADGSEAMISALQHSVGSPISQAMMVLTRTVGNPCSQKAYLVLGLSLHP